jgi:hypothetical protein
MDVGIEAGLGLDLTGTPKKRKKRRGGGAADGTLTGCGVPGGVKRTTWTALFKP